MTSERSKESQFSQDLTKNTDDRHTSDHPIKTETKYTKDKEEDTDEDDNDTRHCLPIKKEEDAYDMDTDDDEESIQNVPDRCMSSNVKNEYDQDTDNEAEYKTE